MCGAQLHTDNFALSANVGDLLMISTLSSNCANYENKWEIELNKKIPEFGTYLMYILVVVIVAAIISAVIAFVVSSSVPFAVISVVVLAVVAGVPAVARLWEGLYCH